MKRTAKTKAVKTAKPSKPAKNVETPEPESRRVNDGTATPAGQTALAVGDVIKIGEGEFIVDMVNDCRARCLPTATRSVMYETTGGKTVEFSTTGKSISISPNIELACIVSRKGEKGLKEFFAAKVARREVVNMANEGATKTKGRKMAIVKKPGDVWVDGKCVANTQGVQPVQSKWKEVKKPKHYPGDTTWDGVEMVLWQMLLAGCYTPAQIIVTLTSGDPSLSAEQAFDLIDFMSEILRQNGKTGAVIAPQPEQVQAEIPVAPNLGKSKVVMKCGPMPQVDPLPPAKTDPRKPALRPIKGDKSKPIAKPRGGLAADKSNQPF